MRHRKCISMLLSLLMVLGLFTGLAATPVLAAGQDGLIPTSPDNATLSPINDFALSGKSDGSASFSFSAPLGATAVKVQQSTDSGVSWTDSTTEALNAASTTATASGLTPNTSYKFKLVVTGGNHSGDSNIIDVTTNSGLKLNWNSASSTDGSITGAISNIVNGSNGNVIALNGNRKVISSTDHGRSWSICSSVSITANALVYDGNSFIIAGNGIMTSTDGLTWVARTANGINLSSYSINTLYTALTSKGQITLAGGSNGLILETSSNDYDGWTKLFISNPNSSYVYFTNFSYVPAHTSGSFNISEEFVSLAGNSIYSITANINDTQFRSVSSFSDTTVQNFNSLWYQDGTFYAAERMDANNIALYTSSNIFFWTSQGTYSTINHSASNGAGIYVMVGNGGSIRTFTDSTGWKNQTMGSADINKVIYAGGMFVAVGNNGTILTSSDGNVWQTCITGTTKNLYSISYNDGTFTAGGNGILLYSGNSGSSTDSDAVAGAKALLSESSLNPVEGTDTNLISKAQSVVSAVYSGVSVTIDSTANSQITGDGSITYGSSSVAGNVTFRLTKNAATDTQVVSITVPAHILTDAEAVSLAKAALTVNSLTFSGSDSANSVTGNIALPAAGIHGTAISWTSSNPSTISNAGIVTRPSNSAVDATVTLTATISKNSASDSKTFTFTVLKTPSNGGGGSSNPIPQNPSTGGGGSSSPAPQPTARLLDSSNTVYGYFTLRLDSSTGTATAELDSASLKSAFDQSAKNDKGIKTVIIDIPKIDGAKAYEPKLPVSFLRSTDSSTAIEIKTDIGSMTLPGNMLVLSDTPGVQNASLTIASVDKTKLNAAIQAQIGSHPVVELSLKLDGKQTDWGNENAPVIAAIPYTPTAGELSDPEHITIWYLDGSGKPISVPNGRYDPAKGKVTFSTAHFGRFAITFVQKTFSDINNYDWAKKPIEVLASKGIINGTSENSFSPAANITRADYIMLLVKTLGLTAVMDGSFDDVKPEDYYYQAVGVAKKLGIAEGSGNNRFNPKESISRQDLMVLTVRALAKFKKLNTPGDAAVLNKFKDKGDIAGYAVDSLATLVKEGLIQGSGDAINPRAKATRAEAAVFLYQIYTKY